MTFDPYRTYDPHRNEPPRDLDESSGGTILLGAALLLAAIGGFIFLYAGPSDQTSRKYDQYVRAPITQPSTKGAAPAPERSSANMPPAPRPRPVE